MKNYWVDYDILFWISNSNMGDGVLVVAVTESLKYGWATVGVDSCMIGDGGGSISFEVIGGISNCCWSTVLFL